MATLLSDSFNRHTGLPAYMSANAVMLIYKSVRVRFYVAHAHARICACVCAYVCVRVCARERSCMHACVCTYAYVYVCMLVYIGYVCM